MKVWLGILFVIILSIFSILPVVNTGFFPMHDDTQVARVFEMGKALRDGMIPVRWVSDLGYGYGYPIFNFYAPLPYYVGGFFTLLGFDALIATKIIIIVGVVLSGIFMYLLGREFFGELAAITAALFYVYAPYHALDLYVRGDISELFAYAFIPLLFYGIWKTYKKKRWIYIVVGSLGFSGIILSHNLTAFMVTPLACLFILMLFLKSDKKGKTLFQLTTILLLGIILSAFYSLPALLEMRYTDILSQIGGGAHYSDHFVCIRQLWDSPWGFGGSVKGCIDGLSFKIGKLHIIGSLAFLVVFLISSKRKEYKNVFFWFVWIGFVISVLLTLLVSKPVWDLLPPMAFLQYPWRFLLLASFFSSLLMGVSVKFIHEILRSEKYFELMGYTTPLALIVLLLLFNVKLFAPQAILIKTSSDYTNTFALKWTASKISDEYLPKNIKKPKNPNELPISTAPGFVAVTVENQRDLFDKYGKNLPEIRFEETSLEKLANLVSMAGVVMLVAGIILERKRIKT